MKQIFSDSNPNVFLLVSLAMWASVALRWTLEFAEQQHPLRWLLNAVLIAYAVLMIVNPFIIRNGEPGAHIYLAAQTALIIGGMLLYYELDFFAILFMPLGGQAVFILPRRKAITWIVIFSLAIVIGQLTQFEFPNGLPFTFLYLAGLFFVASFSTTMLRVNRERMQSDRLLDELQQAHRQLQENAGQAEELATAKERNRLARELHDSVAQTLYGLTLQAEAANRKLRAGQTDEVSEYLQEIRDSAQQTLQETRLLIFELRPPILEQEGLVAALRNRLESVESRSGLRVQMLLQEVGQVRAEVETGLYGIANEALNNILKHARAASIKVSLKKEAGRIVLEIHDDGIGFDVNSMSGGMGVNGMKERAEHFGGDLQIQSDTNGTRLRVEVADE